MENGTLKAKATKKTTCEVCMCAIKREKTFKVKTEENNTEAAKTKIKEMAKNWELTEKQQHCHICWSIVEDLRDAS